MRVLARRQRVHPWLSVLGLFLLCFLCYSFFNAVFGPTPTSLSPLFTCTEIPPLKLVVFGDSWSDNALRPSPENISPSRVAIHSEDDIFYTPAGSSDRSESSQTDSDKPKPRQRKFGRGHGGRWSNGPVWTEYLCDKFECDEELNLAYGGAKVTNQFVNSPVPDLIDQYRIYMAVRNASLAAQDIENQRQIGDMMRTRGLSKEQAKEAVIDYRLGENRGTLFTFFFGINDLIQYITILPTADDRANAVTHSVATIFEIAESLAIAYPQSNFLFLNAIDVTILPIWSIRFTQKDNNMHRFREVVRLAQLWQQETMIHMGRWNHTLASAQLFETNAWLARSVSGIAQDGFKDIKEACFDHSSGKLCKHPQDHFFWDSVHMSTAAHNALADRLGYLNLWPSICLFGSGGEITDR
ncbi:uncharacterized protein V2V93DRAFT_358377 [Kockiozyma suomiensis]|uniref:uncharacterized protein n=1 Tax=Kockiozyma suomiensis TaxID=1337062 RepID=UPI0033437A39